MKASNTQNSNRFTTTSIAIPSAPTSNSTYHLGIHNPHPESPGILHHELLDLTPA